jgi:coenzyme PQQ precursor peptide PqqA
MTQWEKPSFIEIDMSAEIGGYQGDDPVDGNGPDYVPDFVVEQTETA